MCAENFPRKVTTLFPNKEMLQQKNQKSGEFCSVMNMFLDGAVVSFLQTSTCKIKYFKTRKVKKDFSVVLAVISLSR